MKANEPSRSVAFHSPAAKALLCGLALAAIPFLPSHAPAAPAAANADIAGHYTLVAVNGTTVPMTLEHEGAKLVIRSGAFTINADGTCRSRMVFVPPPGQEVTREVNATYTRAGARLTMQWEGAGTTQGTVAGDTFTMDNEGMVLSYRR